MGGRQWETRGGAASIDTRHVYAAGVVVVAEYVWCDPTGDCAGGTATCGTGVPASECCWTLAREFVWGDRLPEPLVMIDHTALGTQPAGTPEPFYYLADALGSPAALTDAAGNIVERYTYDPYGRTHIEQWDASLNGGAGGWATLDASTVGNPLMWTGQRYDAGVRLYHFPFRSYNPQLGRWLQHDPLGYVDGVNLYAYCSQRPTFYYDPFGLWEDELWGAAEVVGSYYYGVYEYGYNAVVGSAISAVTDPHGIQPMINRAHRVHNLMEYGGHSMVGAFTHTILAEGAENLVGGNGLIDAYTGQDAQGRSLNMAERAQALGRSAPPIVMTAASVAGGLSIRGPVPAGSGAVRAGAGMIDDGLQAGVGLADDAVGVSGNAVRGLGGGPRQRLYHLGHLDDGRVSPNRALSTGTDANAVRKLGRDGKLHESNVPKKKLMEWEDEGTARHLRDHDIATGIENEEWRILPPRAGEMNQFLNPNPCD